MPTKANQQVQHFTLPKAETRASTNGSQTVVGLIPYNSNSVNLGGFIERIAPGAFRNSLLASSECLGLVDHDGSKIIGRRSSGTLQLVDTEAGLQFTIDVPQTSYGNDLLISMKRGDVRNCSFGFQCVSDQWSQEAGVPTRILLEAELLECSLVTNPAYESSTAQLRSIVPQELRHLLTTRSVHSDGCECDCSACEDDNCSDCSMDGCEDAACAANGCPEQGEERSTLRWAERTALTLKIMSLQQFEQ